MVDVGGRAELFFSFCGIGLSLSGAELPLPERLVVEGGGEETEELDGEMEGLFGGAE